MEPPLIGSTANAEAQQIFMSPIWRKYVSVFCIDGVPILPPLMTTEKRRQMQKLKEKAIQLEQQLAERRYKRLSLPHTIANVMEEDEAAVSPCRIYSSSSASASQGSNESTDVVVSRQEMEAALVMLSNLIKKREDEIKMFDGAGAESMNGASSSSTISTTVLGQQSDQLLVGRVQKLKKSDTLIYDHCANSIIRPMTDYEELILLKEQSDELEEAANNKRTSPVLRHVDQKVNINSAYAKKFLNFGEELIVKQIPSICVNPPTPLVDNRVFCGSFVSDTEGVTSTDVAEVGEMFSENLTSDESFCCTREELRSHNKVTNVTGKIIKFENLKKNPTIEKEDPTCVIMPPQRSATSPSLKSVQPDSPANSLEVSNSSQSDAPLVRSNSFTLERPSKVLLEHIRQQKVNTKRARKSPTSRAVRDTVESKAKRVQKVEQKTRPVKMNAVWCSGKGTTNKHRNSVPSLSNSSSISKTTRSPYESKTAVKNRIVRQQKQSASSPLIRKQAPKPKPAAVSKTPPINSDLLSEFEAEQRNKFMQLISQQREEQKRLQETFEEQQKVLLQQLTNGIGKVQLKSSDTSLDTSPNPKSEYSEVLPKSPTMSIGSSVLSSVAGTGTKPAKVSNDSSSSTSTSTSATLSSKRTTPRKRLFSADRCATNTSDAVGGGTTKATVLRSRSAGRRSPPVEEDRIVAAVTKINACARGFLVRRLFQTEQIQRIVQTIRDTLIFVLNLHMESLESPEEASTAANIQLKARLLQQLSSASSTLHLVFFQTTIKERMEIIARDRKRIKIKLLTMNMKR